MATIRYTVTNIASGKVTNQWTSDFAGADYYEKSFGKPDRWAVANPGGSVSGEDLSKSDSNRTIIVVPEIPAVLEVLDENGNVVTPAQPEIPAVTQVEYHFPAEYTVTQTDITADLALQKMVFKGLAAQDFGAQIVAQVWAMNESNPNLTAQAFEAILADTTLQQIERCLYNGSLKTAVALINFYTGTAFTPSQIQQVIAMINAYLEANP